MSLIALSGALAVLLDAWHLGPRLPELVRAHGRRLLAFLGIVALNGFTITLLNGFLFYLMVSPYASTVILGYQVRHYFPTVIGAIVLASAILAEEPDPSEAWVVLPGLREGVALVGLSLLLFARTVELAFDLLVRYW